MRNKSFRVNVEIPDGVTVLDVQNYIKTAVTRWQAGGNTKYPYVGFKVTVQPIGAKGEQTHFFDNTHEELQSARHLIKNVFGYFYKNWAFDTSDVEEHLTKYPLKEDDDG